MKRHKTNRDKEALHFMRNHPRYAILGTSEEHQSLELLDHLPPGQKLICCQESPDGHVQVYASHYPSRSAVIRVLVEVIQDLRNAGLPPVQAADAMPMEGEDD